MRHRLDRAGRPAGGGRWQDAAVQPGRRADRPACGDAVPPEPTAIGKHVGSILAKLDLPQTDDTNRRVLAVLAYLRSEGDEQ